MAGVYAFKVVYGCGHVFYSQSHIISTPCPKCGFKTCTVLLHNQPIPEDAEILSSTIVRFKASIARFGKGRAVIVIPKALMPQLSEYLGKHVTVTVEL